MRVGTNSFLFKRANESVGDPGGYEIGEKESVIEHALSGQNERSSEDAGLSNGHECA